VKATLLLDYRRGSDLEKFNQLVAAASDLDVRLREWCAKR
jgi:hypothetical protein